MRSATSYFNFTLLRKNFARFWPIWSLYGLIWLVLLPLGILLSRESGWTQAQARLMPLNYLDGTGAALALSVLFGLLAAMAVFSYLYSSRSVGMLHTLPLRREGLFLTSYLSGLGFLLLPNLAVFLLALAAETACGAVVFSSLFLWLVITSLFNLFFYSFAVFCAMFTGHILALPAFYLILNGLAAGLSTLFSQMARELLLGFSGVDWLASIAVWLTPALMLASNCGTVYPDITDAAGNTVMGEPYFSGLGCAALYGLAGLALAGLALAVYRRRQLESAGDVVSVRWVRPVFKYGVAFCTAVTLGIFFYDTLDPLLPRGVWTLLVLMLVWGAVGCFIAEMLLCKRFWIFKGAWKGCVVFLCCLTAALCVMEFDVIGFEDKVPAAAEVESAQITGVDSLPYDDMAYAALTLDTPEELEALTGLHQSIVEHKGELERFDSDSAFQWIESGGLDVEISGAARVSIQYNQKDGSYLHRTYYLPITQEALDTPGTPAARLEALLNAPGQAEECYFQGWQEGDRLVDAWITTTDVDSRSLPAEALAGLEEAVRADLTEGTLGRRYLLEDEARLEQCYYNDLYLSYRRPNPSSGEMDVFTTCITLQTGAEHTLALLRSCGLDEALVTQAQLQRTERLDSETTEVRQAEAY